MENFEIIVKIKIILQNDVTILRNIRLVPNLIKIAKFLEIKLYL